jgi:nitrite reductase/ring-hydroxylating ferredoxin subunit
MTDNWVKVASLQDVPENGTFLVQCSGQFVCLYNLEGQIYATDDVCTHGQASLADGFVYGANIECPLHQGLFDIRTGKAVGAPCTVDLKVYEVKVEGDDIHLRG